MTKRIDPFPQTYIIRKYQDDEGATKVRIKFEGAVSDPDEDGAFAHPITVEDEAIVTWTPTQSCGDLQSAILAAVRAKHGIPNP